MVYNKGQMIKRFHELQEKILSYYPEANIALLKKAYAISTDAHLNQKRASNEPFITNPTWSSLRLQAGAWTVISCANLPDAESRT